MTGPAPRRTPDPVAVTISAAAAEATTWEQLTRAVRT